VNFELVDVSDADIDFEAFAPVVPDTRVERLAQTVVALEDRLAECRRGYEAQKERADRFAFVRANGSLALVLVDRLIDDMSRGATAWPHRVEEIRVALVRETR
jgi:hypothetical protein